MEDHPNTNADGLLAMLVEFAAKMDDKTEGQAAIEITLLIGGFLVSGQIISARQFLLEHPVTDKFLEVADSLNKQEGKGEQSKEPLSQFIHLAKAHFFVPGQHPLPTDNEGIYWRGRISEVAGFNFGVLRVTAQ